MSAASMNIKNFNLTLKMEEQATRIPLPPSLPRKVGIMKQGIVSILGSDSERNKATAASIRRTLSADMSSKKWLSQNGVSPMKKIASSDELVNLGQDDVWRSIQNNNQKEPTSVDVWSSIISQKTEENSTLPPPYIHPLIKKSSSLTEKSLEICTESLGSETGSEISFPSYPPSETGDIDEEKDHQQQDETFPHDTSEDIPVVKYNKKSYSFSPPKSFPPPIRSLARDDNSSVQMQSHRQNGRLILEAVSVPPQNLFRAKRVEGRLLLTLISTSDEKEIEEDHQDAEFEKVLFDDIQDVEYDETLTHYEDEEDEEDDDDDDVEVEEKENGTKGMQIVLEQKPRLSNGGTLMMKQIMGLEKKKNNLTWSNNFNKAIPQSLPMVSQLITSPNPPSAATSFNAYEHFWRKSPTVTTNIVNNYDDRKVVPTANGTVLNANSTAKIASYEQQDLVVMRGNKANINYLLKGCKEQRRSLLFWEPYCIATS